jgi:hypothetical protein
MAIQLGFPIYASRYRSQKTGKHACLSLAELVSLRHELKVHDVSTISLAVRKPVPGAGRLQRERARCR